MAKTVNYQKLFDKLKENRPEHATFSPSSSDKWLNCLGWYQATKDLPSTPSGKAAKRGTAAHELLEQCLLQDKFPEDLATDVELIDWVGYALDYVNAYKATNPKAKIFPEVYFPWMHVSGGTIDVLGISPTEYMIGDLKTGSVYVPVEDNAQLLNYALATRHHLGRKKQYRLVIIQPGGVHSSGPIREWVIGNDVLDEFSNKAISAMFVNLMGADRNAGSHCKYCKAEAVCKDNGDYVLKKVKLSLKEDFLEPL